MAGDTALCCNIYVYLNFSFFFFDCKEGKKKIVFRHERYHHWVLTLGVAPAIISACITGFGGISGKTVETTLWFCFGFNLAEILLRWFAFGFRRFLDLIALPDPPLIQHAVAKWLKEQKLDTDDPSYDNLKWKIMEKQGRHLKAQKKKKKKRSKFDRKEWILINRLEAILFIGALIGIVLSLVFGRYRSVIIFLQVSLMRMFTVLPSIRIVLASLYDIVPKFGWFVVFIAITIFCFARLGTTLFAGKSSIVLPEVYDGGSDANFDDMGNSLMSLFQMLLQNGWTNIMCY
ncbi:hypothetical protein RFI_14612, partial [Reticulomyxa filosa]